MGEKTKRTSGSSSAARKYSVSKNEMKRRRNAFVKLVISFYLTTFILLFNEITLFPKISIPIAIIFAVVFISLIFAVDRMFRKQADWQICLSDKYLKRDFGKTSEKYLLSDINVIRIKRTTHGSIREITFKRLEGKNFFISGLDDFEKFNDDVISHAKNAKIINYKEPPVDYDHPLFYVFLGPILSAILILPLKLLLSVGEANFKYIQFAIACFLIVTGIFFIVKQPTSGRYGMKKRVADLVIGLLFFAVGALTISLVI